MSYILDALRRADAERERDPARGIHAQPTAGAPAAARPPVPGWAWPLAALAVAGALVFAWQRPGQEPAAPQLAVGAPPPAAPAVAPAPALPAPTVVAVADVVSPPPPPMPIKPRVERAKPAATAAATPHAPAAPAKAAATVVAANTPGPNTAAPAPVPVATPATAPVPAATPATARRPAAAPAAGNAAQPGALATAKVAPAAAAAAPVATAAGNRVFNPAELPADVQGALPKLAITGGVYSDNAAQRMLIVGGQVVNEGAELAPGVVLDQIRSRSAVLRFRGYRYAVSY